MPREYQPVSYDEPAKSLSHELDRNNHAHVIEHNQRNCNTLAHQIRDWQFEREAETGTIEDEND